MDLLQEYVDTAGQPLSRAVSLPFGAYTHPDIHAAEIQHIFAGEWIFVCMAGELAVSGDYIALTVGAEPLVVLRGGDGQLRALSNVCRHRGTVLLDEGPGRVDKYITCPYHAWAYDTAGTLLAVPHDPEGLVDRQSHPLKRYLLEEWNGLVFVNLNPAARPLAERLADIDAYLQRFAPHAFDQVRPGGSEIWKANWKLAMENAMESYHLFKVHEHTLEPVSPTRGAYYIAGSSEWTLTGGTTRRKRGLIEKIWGTSGDDLHEHYILIALPPSFVGVLTWGSLGWLSAHPIDAGHTRIRSGVTFAGGGMAGDPQEESFTQAFFAEDKAICERVHRGMGSRLMQGGKLVTMERVVVDFHHYLASRLSSGNPSKFFQDEAASRWLNAP